MASIEHRGRNQWRTEVPRKGYPTPFKIHLCHKHGNVPF